MKILLIFLLSVPFLAFGQKNDKADCLIALSKIDFPKNSSPATISPEPRFRWQWDGKEISLLEHPGQITAHPKPQPVWSVEKYKETGDGRIGYRYLNGAKLPSEDMMRLQKTFLKLSFLTLLRTEPTDNNAIELDKMYSECEGVNDVTPAKARGGKKPIVTNKSIGELSRVNREKIRSQFPQIFKTSTSGPDAGVK